MTRSGPSRWPGTPRQLTGVSGAARRGPDEPRDQPQRHRAAGEYHRSGRAGDAQPERLRRRGTTARPWSPQTRSSSARCCPQHPVDRTLLHPLLDTCRQQLTQASIRPKLRTALCDSGYVSEETFTRAEADGLRLLAPLAKDPGKRRTHRPPARPCTWNRPSGYCPRLGGACYTPRNATTTNSAPRLSSRCSGSSRPARN